MASQSLDNLTVVDAAGVLTAGRALPGVFLSRLSVSSKVADLISCVFLCSYVYLILVLCSVVCYQYIRACKVAWQYVKNLEYIADSMIKSPASSSDLLQFQVCGL